MFLGVIAATAALLVAPFASAHYATVTASLDCNGTVSYTVKSWVQTADTKTVKNLQGENPDIQLVDSLGNTESGAFNNADGFQFSGSYTVATSVTSLTLTPSAVAAWGDNEGPGTYTAQAITITRPTNCVKSPTLSTSLSPSSVTVGQSTHDTATLTGATSNAGGSVTYTVYTNNTCNTVAAGEGTFTVTNGSVPSSNSAFVTLLSTTL